MTATWSDENSSDNNNQRAHIIHITKHWPPRAGQSHHHPKDHLNLCILWFLCILHSLQIYNSSYLVLRHLEPFTVLRGHVNEYTPKLDLDEDYDAVWMSTKSWRTWAIPSRIDGCHQGPGSRGTQGWAITGMDWGMCIRHTTNTHEKLMWEQDGQIEIDHFLRQSNGTSRARGEEQGSGQVIWWAYKKDNCVQIIVFKMALSPGPRALCFCHQVVLMPLPNVTL